MQVQREIVSLTTDAAGNATGYTDTLTGVVLAIHYIKTDFATGVDFVVTAEATGEAIWTGTNVDATATVYPRAQVDSVTGAALEYAAGFAQVAPVAIANDRVKIAISSGGNTKTGTFHVVIG